MLVPFGQDLYIADGPEVSFSEFPYPTRMAVARLSTGRAWVWSPIALTNELAAAVEGIGPVSYIVSPNQLHLLFLAEWSNHWPDARLFAPPGLARKKPQLHFEAELREQKNSPWATDIDQVVFRGSLAMEEVVFFHRASRTAIVGDLIQRFPESSVKGWRGLVMRLGGLVGPHGSTPPDWRLTFLSRDKTRAALATVLERRPQRLSSRTASARRPARPTSLTQHWAGSESAGRRRLDRVHGCAILVGSGECQHRGPVRRKCREW